MPSSGSSSGGVKTMWLSHISVYTDRQLIAYECQAQKVAVKAW
jgi:hypothetical protein